MTQTQTNTVNAIVEADSQLYRSQVAGQAIVNDVIDQMINDPFYTDIIQNYLANKDNKNDIIRIGYNSGIMTRLGEEMVNFLKCLPFLAYLAYQLIKVLS